MKSEKIVLLIFMLLFLSYTPVKTSRVSDSIDMSQIYQAIDKEDWSTTARLSNTYINSLDENDDRQSQLRYIYIYALAGKVSQDQMQKQDLEVEVKKFIGKVFEMPGHPISNNSRSGCLNVICELKDKDNVLFTGATNKDGTTILCFEYVQIEEDIDLNQHSGKVGRLGGQLRSFEVNSGLWILRLHFENGYIKLRR